MLVYSTGKANHIKKDFALMIQLNNTRQYHLTYHIVPSFSPVAGTKSLNCFVYFKNKNYADSINGISHRVREEAV